MWRSGEDLRIEDSRRVAGIDTFGADGMVGQIKDLLGGDVAPGVGDLRDVAADVVVSPGGVPVRRRRSVALGRLDDPAASVLNHAGRGIEVVREPALGHIGDVGAPAVVAGIVGVLFPGGRLE